MKKENGKKVYTCSFSFAIDALSGKWKGRVLWQLSHKTQRYGELRKLIDGITQKMLTQTLRELENAHIITRKVYAVVPPKVEYSLSKYGKRLIPILESLHQWGEETSKELRINFTED